MKKIQILLIFGLLLYSCKKNVEKQVESGEMKADKNESKKDLKFRLYNSTDFELKDVTVGLPDTVLTYDMLEKGSQTEWTNVKSAYHYGFIRFFDIKNRKYFIQPIDYVGETPYEKGEMKFIVKSIDTSDQSFELDFDYRNN